MIEIISKKCVDILPLSAEPVSLWNSNTDLRMFLVEMFELGGYSSYGESLFKEGLKSWKNTVTKFQKNATKAIPAPGAEKQTEPIPDFRSDSYFGLMAKYSIAWDSADRAVLEESAFFSLAHVLEAGTDLNASILLASHLLYKQALQMLRNYLEGMVLQLYFCHNYGDFEEWKSGEYKVPFLRGKNGLLEILMGNGILDPDLSKLASDLYGDLNGCIHGAERRLVHAGLFEGKWAGEIFRYARFKEWCELFSKCTYFGIHALRLGTNLWQSKCPQDKVCCEICHNENVAEFEIDKSRINGGTVSFRCKRCGCERGYVAEWAIKQGY